MERNEKKTNTETRSRCLESLTWTAAQQQLHMRMQDMSAHEVWSIKWHNLFLLHLIPTRYIRNQLLTVETPLPYQSWFAQNASSALEIVVQKDQFENVRVSRSEGMGFVSPLLQTMPSEAQQYFCNAETFRD